MEAVFKRLKKSFYPVSMRIIWVSGGFLTLFSMNRSFANFLYDLSLISSSTRPAIISAHAFWELVLFLLNGWALFTVFIRPGASSSIFSAEVSENQEEIALMVTILGFVIFVRPFIMDTFFRVFRMGSVLSNWSYAIFGVVAFILGIASCTIWLRSRKSKEKDIIAELSGLASKKKIQKALEKISDRLTESEKDELCQLLYQSHGLKKATVQSLAKTLRDGLVYALAWEIATEFFGRL